MTMIRDPDLPHPSAQPPPDPNDGVSLSIGNAPQFPPPGFGPREPITTFVSALPPTPYEEQKELGDSKRTLTYVQVQQKVLKYLETQSPHSLNSRQARTWTQAIDSTGSKTPRADEALRLCYYMRKQGYDSYSKIQDTTINLYVVNQDSCTRDPRHDHLYWKQNIATNEVEFMAPSPGARSARRNAVPNVEMLFQTFDRSNSLSSSAAAGNYTTGQRAAIAAAEACVQIQLEQEPHDPDALAAAIQHLEELRDEL
ncbi:hypothetical protein DE146DRAFT_788000 [Phaeosphaeria sp. MPI-PUGE-AT-0046c]|nr:hypothetical protein DE146DRAFT_788000 [Phaeosphaeria sp. MPI-PUGE-AT-0046c]